MATTTFKARFDGKVLIPESPLDLLPETEVELRIVPSSSPSREELEREMREYYDSGGETEEDADWIKTTSQSAAKVWREMDKD